MKPLLDILAIILVGSVMSAQFGGAIAETPKKKVEKKQSSSGDNTLSSTKSTTEKKQQGGAKAKPKNRPYIFTRPVPTPSGTPYAEPGRATNPVPQPSRSTSPSGQSTEPRAAARSNPDEPGTGGRQGITTSAARPGSGAAIVGAGAAVIGANALLNHNSSTMRYLADGDQVRLVYEAPRAGLGDLGIQPGTELFNGRKTGPNSYAGEATTFSPRQCGATHFAVAGEASSNGRQVTLRGQAPVRNAGCQVTGYRNENLVFVVR